MEHLIFLPHKNLAGIDKDKIKDSSVLELNSTQLAITGKSK